MDPSMNPIQPLLLVPGLMCNEAVWMPVIPLIAHAAQCHVVDHGEAHSLTRMAEELLTHAPDRFALAGHSMGARVALEVYRQAPDRVGRIALLDSGYLPCPPGDAGVQEKDKRHQLLHMARAQGVRSMAREWVQGMVHPQRLSDVVLIETILDMFDCKTTEIFAAQVQALLNRPDATAVLKSLQVPTLMACGSQDLWAPPAQHQAMQAWVSHATLEIIPNAGHMLPMEQPQATAEVLLRWLQGQPDH